MGTTSTSGFRLRSVSAADSTLGRPMIGRYLLFEGEDMSFRELKLRPNKACPLCGENPTVDSLIDYEAWCGTPAIEPSEARAS